MLFIREARAVGRGVLGVALAVGLAALTIAATAARERNTPVAKPDSTAPAFTPPEVGDTRTNLRAAFTNEMNAKTRYEAWARQADREGYPYVAQLFRACARAEQIHADRHVHAIAWVGGEARAVLEHLVTGTTQENLRRAVEFETYEATQLYPAMVERARADRQPEAVRSMNFALATEREHARLFATALETLGQRLPPRAIYVCPFCGKTTEALGFAKCPSCFTPARRFIRVT